MPRGGKRTPIHDRVKDEIAQLYKSGNSSGQISKATGASGSTISRVLAQRGVISRVYASEHNKHGPQIVADATRLYEIEELTLPEVARTLGVGVTTVARWMRKAGVQRSMSQAFAISKQRGRKAYRSMSIPWQSAKTGRWEFADSRYEAVRMGQLDGDGDVVFWTRMADRVPYIDQHGIPRTYAPDFFVKYADGRQEVEEVKPSSLVSRADVVAKTAAAERHFSGRGIAFKVVTEREIGLKSIRAFRLSGLSLPLQEEMDIRRRSQRAAGERKRRAFKRAQSRDTVQPHP